MLVHSSESCPLHLQTNTTPTRDLGQTSFHASLYASVHTKKYPGGARGGFQRVESQRADRCQTFPNFLMIRRMPPWRLHDDTATGTAARATGSHGWRPAAMGLWRSGGSHGLRRPREATGGHVRPRETTGSRGRRKESRTGGIQE